MYHLTPCKVVEAEVFMRLPDHLRRDKAPDLTPWARQQHPGVPVAGDTGMVDDHGDAAEGPLDGVGRLDEAAHVLVLVLAAVDGAIERVDNDDGGR